LKKETQIEYRNYVIAVHGIGDQRPNETILPVINRFAEIRHQVTRTNIKQVVTLGMVTAQTGKPQRVSDWISFGGCQPWAEFRHIPSQKPENIADLPPFYGEQSKDNTNIRFVDMYWSDVMQRNFKDVGQEVKRWAESLTGRLERKQKAEGIKQSESWVLPILYSLEETFRFLQNNIFLKLSLIDKSVFDDYLGDIQLYGEYEVVRGEAIRRFHQLFEKMEQHHKKEEGVDDDYFCEKTNTIIRPRYTIISHSLGTVLSTEALLYASTKSSIFESKNKADLPENFPLKGYHVENQNKEDYLGKGWIENVDNLITLGSPVDKFLTIWWKNYKYLDQDDYLVEPKQKIKTFNYCDEQDPVGHTIDIVEDKKAFKKIFSSKEDIVYNRYIVPGTAHTAYWEDVELFERIIERSIDSKPFEDIEIPKRQGKDEFLICKKEVYARVLFFTYFFAPLLSILVLGMLYIGFFHSEIFILKVIMGSLGVFTAYLALRLIKLMIWWRQVLRTKHQKASVIVEGQEQLTALFVNSLRFLVVFHTLGAILYVPQYILYANERGLFTNSGTSLFWEILFTGLAATLIYRRFRSIKRIHIPEYSLRNTLIYSLILCCVILLLSLSGITLLKGSFLFGSIIFSTYFTISAIIWTYTSYCYLASKNVLQQEN
jgi:hypothetical protein